MRVYNYLWWLRIVLLIQMEGGGQTFSYVCMLSHVRLFVALWTVALKAPLFMGFPRQEYWLEWVAISSSRGSFLPKNQARISWIAVEFFTAEPSGKLFLVCASSQFPLFHNDPYVKVAWIGLAYLICNISRFYIFFKSSNNNKHFEWSPCALHDISFNNCILLTLFCFLQFTGKKMQSWRVW